MKVSTRTRYGIRAILELAGGYGRGPMTLASIAARQEISVKYLEQLMTILRSAGFVRSVRGSRGGYLLVKDPAAIKLSNVFDALEGPMVTAECLEDQSYCTRTADCVARGLWTQVQQAVNNVLQSITLQQMIDNAGQKKTVDYQI